MDEGILEKFWMLKKFETLKKNLTNLVSLNVTYVKKINSIKKAFCNKKSLSKIILFAFKFLLYWNP